MIQKKVLEKISLGLCVFILFMVITTITLHVTQEFSYQIPNQVTLDRVEQNGTILISNLAEETKTISRIEVQECDSITQPFEIEPETISLELDNCDLHPGAVVNTKLVTGDEEIESLRIIRE